MKRILVTLSSRTIVFSALAIANLYGAVPTGPPPGMLVDVAGHKMHIHCAGPTNSQPVVIFEAGGGGDSRDWNQVRNLLPTDIRTCAYDRAGLGWSEGGPAPRTMHQEVLELHALLEAAKIRGPYVMVGQSIGGLLIRLFNQQYGRNVVGVVLVDPTHESGMLGSLRYGGWVRLREKATGLGVPEPHLEGVPPSWKQLKAERDDQIRDLAGLSRNSKFILDPTSTHAIHMDNPQAVAQAIEEVVNAAVHGTKLGQ